MRLNHARHILYLSHFFNQFSESTWQFCLVLCLAAYSNYESLFLVTLYGLVSYAAVCVAGPRVGSFLDTTLLSRLVVAQRLICMENCAVLAATAMCYRLLVVATTNSSSSSGGIPTSESSESIVLLVGIYVFGACAAILDSGFLVAMERDWIVVMSQEASNHHVVEQETREDEETQWLSDTNVAMRQIDLSCKVGAPAVAGFVVAWFDGSSSSSNESSTEHVYDIRGAVLLVGGINSLALIVESICVAKVYSDVPRLGQPSSSLRLPAEPLPDTALSGSTNSNGDELSEQVIQKLQEDNSHSWWFQLLPYSFQVYFGQQPICWAGFSLSLLYLNVVLTFGGIMTAYLVWRGMGMGAIGFWRGVSSAAGLSGTVVYHVMASRVGLVDVGMMSVVFQFLCLSACYASLFVKNDSVSFAMLIAGVCFSRAGLWVFDIAVTQLMQQHIPAPIRGLVGGVQQSLNAFFTLGAFSLGLFLSDPKYFHVYASAAYGGVGLAVVFYAHKVYSSRKHL